MALIALLKANGPLVAALPAAGAIKEAEWRGTNFDYPAIRLDITGGGPQGNGACAEGWTGVAGSVIALSKEDSSGECLTLLGLIQDALQRKHLPGLAALEVKIDSTTYPFRELNLWRGEVLFATTVIQT
ncbi:MAG: hypothetical protein A2V88_08875 [Elusimicrobia bacterium RBG_16_66_12]|nr:MAG: hypothetical protein A2V88_08875 [Elusimicrobia bacterium RBG_16_66_12]